MGRSGVRVNTCSSQPWVPHVQRGIVQPQVVCRQLKSCVPLTILLTGHIVRALDFPGPGMNEQSLLHGPYPPRFEAGIRASPSCPATAPFGADRARLALDDCASRTVVSSRCHRRNSMANKDIHESSQGKGKGEHPLVPANESTKEAGPRRLYAGSGSPGSTSTKEAGPRRLYSSGSGPSGS